MGRPQKFSTDALLDAAGQAALLHWRDATIAQVAELSGAPVGSLYHRFGSREELFARLWLRSIGRFHQQLLGALDDPDPHRAALAAALTIPQFCRAHPLEATAMTLFSRAELLATGPASVREQVEQVNDLVTEVFDRLARQLGGADQRGQQLVACACIAGPYGLVRPYVRAGQPLPAWMEQAVSASSSAILQLVPPVG